MIEKRLNGISPTRLRLILCATIIAIIIAAGAGFWFFKDRLVNYAATVEQMKQEADASASDVAALQKLKTELEENVVAVNRAKSIVAESKSYQYQNQIIEDLNIYAKATGVAIASYVFADNNAAASTTTGGASTPAASPVPTIAGGPKSTSVTVTLKSPANYKAVMRFIHAIEINLTKMQLTGISLTGPTSEESRSDEVTVNPLTIEVYIR